MAEKAQEKTPARPREQERGLAATLKHAGKRALGGGLPGAAAMAVQVCSLMWLRTTMNYQYRYGTTTTEAIRTLYKQGGILRFYRGVLPALAQGPLSRFGDTAANSGMLALLGSYELTKDMPIGFKTMAASAAAGLWRINLMPIDTVKTIMQVEGSNGIPALKAKYKVHGLRVFYHGALAASAGTMAGHFPWFFTHNLLDERIPKPDEMYMRLIRAAAIGFCSSAVSDTTANSIRVIKVVKQASTTNISYPAAVREIIVKDGVYGLFFRGLKTRLITNGLQGMLFTVLWKSMEDYIRKREKM
eukprot:m.74654 g.74654  ORF g.74654 m.74654 type:complete len:302 (+) comp14523_c0_seq3:196-1101(+)